MELAEPLRLVIASLDRAAQVDLASGVGIAEVQHLVLRLDEPGAGPCPQRRSEVGSVQDDVQRTQNVRVGSN